MQTLTEKGRAIVETLASRHNVSFEAARAVLFALVAGDGTQAQFNHPDLGGMGQWSQGGMVMIGDMFNHGLKARVDALCVDLAEALRQGLSLAMRQPPPGASASLCVPVAPSSRWPEELGTPASSGSQNDLHYAFFPQTQRLALDHGGRVTVYDTGDHRITGFAQAQGGGQSISFTSQHGLIDLAALRQISPDKAEPAKAAPVPSPASLSDEEIFSRIERLAALHEKKIITSAEFDAKKAELLARL